MDGREASLVRAMGIEVIRYLERAGVPFMIEPDEPMGPSTGDGA